MVKQRITPCLWFDSKAEEAAKFYTSIFPNSKILEVVPYNVETPSNKPIGSVMTISFELEGYKFLGLNGGPYFKMNPSVSFFLNYDPSRDKGAQEKLDRVWEKLSSGGKVLMPLQEYPFSKRYGWIEDKYGLSWQLILSDPKGEERPFIVPSLLFVGAVCGKAEKAIDFYLSVFKNTKRGIATRYPEGMEPDKEGTIMFADFILNNQWFAAMDSAHEHKFAFNEAVSFIIECTDQKEINYFYEKLSNYPEAEICGWLKDKFGISWQLVTPDFEKLAKKKEVMEAILKMKRIDVEKLKKLNETV